MPSKPAALLFFQIIHTILHQININQSNGLFLMTVNPVIKDYFIFSVAIRRNWGDNRFKIMSKLM